jgi:hypothetical protein
MHRAERAERGDPVRVWLSAYRLLLRAVEYRASYAGVRVCEHPADRPDWPLQPVADRRGAGRPARHSCPVYIHKCTCSRVHAYVYD